MENNIQVLLVEDDRDWLRGLSYVLKYEDGIEIVGETSCGKEAVHLANKLDVDVVLMDVSLANSMDGVQTTEMITNVCDSKVIMLTSIEEDGVVYDAFKAGAVDYIVKTNFEEIPDAIRAAYSDSSPIRPCVSAKLRKEFCRLKKMEAEIEVDRIRGLITPTEMAIIQLIDQGYTQTQIAEEKIVSIRTVKNHVGNVLKKVGEKTSKDAAKRLRELGVY